MKSTTRAKLAILHMEVAKDWRWLTGHREPSPGVWLMIAKKSGAP